MSGRWLAGAALTLASLALALTPCARAAWAADEGPEAIVVLEAAPATPGSEPSGAPPRFVLLKDGQAFAGGTSRLATVRLEKNEAQALRRRVDAARKAIGRTERSVSLGEGGATVRLRFGEEPPVEVRLGRDRRAPAPGQPLEPVAALVTELLAFQHPGLAPYAPTSYVMLIRPGTLAGGCRRWNFNFSLTTAVAATRVVTAEQAQGWPTGALPASVCGEGDTRYVMTLRPLLPGERP